MTPVPIPMDQTRGIVAEIAGRYGYPVQTLTGKRRTRPVAALRFAAYAEVKARRPHLSLIQIGRIFGGRDHSTICTGIQTHEARMAWVEVLIAAAGEYQPDLFARAA